ncbi:MAG: hypothetical protein ABI885_15950 [Gammaproteobacteria bacterium]
MMSLLALSPTPDAGWRLLAAVVAVALAWHPMFTIVFQRGAASVRRCEWSGGGVWVISDQAGVRRPARLLPATAAFGPWILLVWAGQAGNGRGKRYALIDAAGVSPRDFRTLRGRLTLGALRAFPVDAR